MHLIVIIAIGVFAGLWLFVHWCEWRAARWERQIERAYLQQAEPPPPPPPPPPPTAADEPVWQPARGPSVWLAKTSMTYRVTACFVGSVAVLYIADALMR